MDKILVGFLKNNLPDGKYPEDVGDYLAWDDNTVWNLIKTLRILMNMPTG